MPLSKRGNAYYLLVIDVATRFLFLRPLASKSSYSVAQQLLRLFCDVGFRKIIQSDDGGEFVNSVMAALKKLYGIDERLILHTITEQTEWRNAPFNLLLTQSIKR